jgi:hypothetical protein
MEELKKNIEASGLLKSFIADKVGVSSAHLSMMLNEKATMPEDVRNKITLLLKQASKIAC